MRLDVILCCHFLTPVLVEQTLVGPKVWLPARKPESDLMNQVNVARCRARLKTSDHELGAAWGAATCALFSAVSEQPVRSSFGCWLLLAAV